MHLDDRKMKNDEEYLLKKLYCGISRIRSYDRIVRIRGPIDTPRQKRSYRSSQTYTTSISHDFSTDLEFFTIDILNNSKSFNTFRFLSVLTLRFVREGPW
jgi:hypothetical protein